MGRKQFESVTVVGSYPSRKVVMKRFEYTSELLKGNDLYVDLYAQTGHQARILGISLEYNPITNATSGYHEVAMFTGTQNEVGLLLIRSNVTSRSLYYCGEVVSGGEQLVYPTSKDNQSRNIDRMVYDDLNPLRVRFSNRADINDTNAKKKVVLWIEEERVI